MHAFLWRGALNCATENVGTTYSWTGFQVMGTLAIRNCTHNCTTDTPIYILIMTI